MKTFLVMIPNFFSIGFHTKELRTRHMIRKECVFFRLLQLTFPFPRFPKERSDFPTLYEYNGYLETLEDISLDPTSSWLTPPPSLEFIQ